LEKVDKFLGMLGRKTGKIRVIKMDEFLARVINLRAAITSLRGHFGAGLAYIVGGEMLDRVHREVYEPLNELDDALKKLFEELVPKTEDLHYDLLEVYRWAKEKYWRFSGEIQRQILEDVKNWIEYEKLKKK